MIVLATEECNRVVPAIASKTGQPRDKTVHAVFEELAPRSPRVPSRLSLKIGR